MGYSNYYTLHRDLTSEEWGILNALVADIADQFCKLDCVGTDKVALDWDYNHVALVGTDKLALDWHMNADELVLNGKGEGQECCPFRVVRESITNPNQHRLKHTQEMNRCCLRIYKYGKSGMCSCDGEHVASLWRLFNPGMYISGAIVGIKSPIWSNEKMAR